MIRRLSLALLLFAAAAALYADPADGHRTIIIRNGKVLSSEGDLFRRVYLGFSPLDVSSELREFLGAPKDGGGVLVQSVKEGGPAAKAGLKVGDFVTAVDGKPVESAWNIGDLLDDKKAGDSVRLDVIRNHQRQTLMATLEERELPMKVRTLDIPDLEHLRIPALDHLKAMDGMPPMWRARVETTENCADLQARIHDLEARLKTLEKKLEK